MLVAKLFISWEFYTFIPSQKHEKDIHPCVDLSGFCIKYINGQNRKESIYSVWCSTFCSFENIKWSNNFSVSPLPTRYPNDNKNCQKWPSGGLYIHQVVAHNSCKKVSTRKQWSAYLTNQFTQRYRPSWVLNCWDCLFCGLELRRHCWWFRNPANHLGCIKPGKWWDKLPINWCRISSINSISLKLQGISWVAADTAGSVFLGPHPTPKKMFFTMAPKPKWKWGIFRWKTRDSPHRVRLPKFWTNSPYGCFQK